MSGSRSHPTVLNYPYYSIHHAVDISSPRTGGAGMCCAGHRRPHRQCSHWTHCRPLLWKLEQYVFIFPQRVLGLISGLLTMVESLEVREFLGIPYVKPPVGNLRFAPPQKMTPWKKPFEAAAFGNSCYNAPFAGQDSLNAPFNIPPPDNQTEDCVSALLYFTMKSACAN